MENLHHYYDKDHLSKKNLTYTEHLKFGLINSFYLIVGGILGILHSFCPHILVNVQTDTVTLVGELLKDTNKEKKDTN